MGNAYSLNSKYYGFKWLKEEGKCMEKIAPHQDANVLVNRIACLKRLFPDLEKLLEVHGQFGILASGWRTFNSYRLIEIMMSPFTGGQSMDTLCPCSNLWHSDFSLTKPFHLVVREAGITTHSSVSS
ncbi:hypothetical protein AMTR_s00829p00008100, partial [Amborella trichopoda]